MKTLSKIIAVLLLPLSIASCSKQKDAVKPVSKTATEIILAHAWKISAYQENGQDKYATYGDCSKDDVFHYSSNGVLLVDNGLAHCIPNEPVTYNYLWSLSPDEKTLNITTANSTTSYQVLQITGDTLQISFTVNNITMTFIFSAQ